MCPENFWTVEPLRSETPPGSQGARERIVRIPLSKHPPFTPQRAQATPTLIWLFDAALRNPKKWTDDFRSR